MEKKNIILILQLLNLSGQFKVDRIPLYKLLVNVKLTQKNVEIQYN